MATQKGRNWSSGNIVTAANLSSVERGVSAVAEEYTPTTWANGDTVTAAALNNIEQGIANAGGSSWTTLTEESVFCEDNGGWAGGDLSYAQLISADTIRVTFDGVEYECPRMEVEIDEEIFNVYGGFAEEAPDFSQYPFIIQSESPPYISNVIITETEGTHTVKIEAPQSGGSSDFSTAQMAIIGGSLEVVETDARISYLNADKIKSGNFFSTGTYEVILYQGLLEVEIYPNVTATTGDASITPGDKSDFLTITGDCTITISDDVAEA